MKLLIMSETISSMYRQLLAEAQNSFCVPTGIWSHLLHLVKDFPKQFYHISPNHNIFLFDLISFNCRKISTWFCNFPLFVYGYQLDFVSTSICLCLFLNNFCVLFFSDFISLLNFRAHFSGRGDGNFLSGWLSDWSF